MKIKYSSTKRAIFPPLSSFQYIEFWPISKAFQPFVQNEGRDLIKGSGQKHFISVVLQVGRPILLKLEITVMVLPMLIQFQGYYLFFFFFFKENFALGLLWPADALHRIAPYPAPLQGLLLSTHKAAGGLRPRPCFPAGNSGSFPPSEGVWWPGTSPDSNSSLGLRPLPWKG